MPTAARSVQLTTPEQVEMYYTDQELPAFTISHGPNRFARYDGESMDAGLIELQTAIDMLKKSESAAIYTLSLFGAPRRKGKKLTTEFIDLEGKPTLQINFRFRVLEHGQLGAPAGGVGMSYEMTRIIEDNKALRQEITELRKALTESEETDENENQLGSITELLKIPAVSAFLQTLLSGSMQTQQQIQQPAASMAGPVGNEQQRLENALTIIATKLKGGLPELTGHLEKLASIAQTNPKKFDALITTLQMF